jgi:glycine/D-amino acid oxidase-like deaminating enzyme
MKRRQLLQSLTLAAAIAPFGRSRAATPTHVVVIGAGILGASIAYHLVKRGARVTVLEKVAPASGATGDSFAYLNASTKPSRPYYDLNLMGIAGWRRLQLELGGALPLQWGGAVYWRNDVQASAQLLTTLRGYEEWGYDGRRLAEDELRRILPNAKPGHIEGAVFYQQEGSIDPAAAVSTILTRAKALGATVEFPVEVTDLEVAGNRIHGVRTSRGKLEADAVVIAAGLGSQALANVAGAKLPLEASTGVLAHTAPQPRLTDIVVFAPGSTLKQNLDGRVVSSSSFEGSALTLSPEEQGAQIIENAARYFPQLEHVAVDRVTVGHRVLPADGFPILGFLGNLPNLYVAATHSGVTLAPIIGQFVAQELLDGISVDALKIYRPSRFS